MRIFGPPNVEKLRSKKKIRALIKALGYKKESTHEGHKIRKAAAQALGEIGDKRAVLPLANAITDNDWGVHEASSEALRRIGSLAADILIGALENADTDLLRIYTKALGIIGDDRSVDPLIAMLEEKDQVVRRNAAEALGLIGDTRAVEPLINCIKDYDPVSGGVKL